MQSLRLQIGKFACLAISVGTVLAAQGTKPAAVSNEGDVQAFYRGRAVNLEIESTGLRRLFTLGPWHLGTKVLSPKPNDKRPNLYVVVPGNQHQNDRWREFDHNLLVSELSPSAREWDVYYGLILDPSLEKDFHEEAELIMAEQQSFSSADLELENIPSIGVLRQVFKVKTKEDLKKFERSNGQLPRVAIVSASAAVRASTTEVLEQGPTDEAANPN